MLRDEVFCVTPEEAGLRLDAFVRGRAPGSSRALVAEAIREGRISCDTRPAVKSTPVQAGDVVRVRELAGRADLAVTPDPAVPLDVLFADETLLALCKPAGLPVHPLRAGERWTLAGGLVARYPALAGVGDDPLFPALVHRLDTATSGVMIAARTEAAYKTLRAEFRSHGVTKEYVALVHGRVSQGGTLDDLLAHADHDARRMLVVQPGSGKGRHPLRAVTHYQVQESLGAFSLLAVRIDTGVTHQIRCQLASIGFPVAGDRRYGGRTEVPPGLERQFLHAAAITITHPATAQRLRVEAPLAADLAAVLLRLRQAATGQ